MTSVGAEFSEATRFCDVAQPRFASPDAIALSGVGDPITYRVLNDRIESARAAYAHLGLAPGNRVVLLLPNSPEFVIAYFGAHRAGLVVIPLNPLLGPDEVEFILKAMRPALVVAAHPDLHYPVLKALSRLPALSSSASRLIHFGGDREFDLVMKRAPMHLPAVERAGTDEALILFTSGTSGAPKGVSHAESSLMANARHANSVFELGPRDVLLCPLPLSHVFGQLVVMLGAFMAGAELLLLPPRPSPAAIFDALTERSATFMAAVPTTYAALVECGRAAPNRVPSAQRRLRFALSGGAPLPATIAEDFETVFGVPLHQGYGMTEVACCIAIESPSERPTGGVGKLCAPLQHRLVPIDEAMPNKGELQLSGPNLLRGYYIDGNLQARMPEDWFATGDMVRTDVQGNLFLFDRKKEIIIRNGYNVYPSEVEATLTAHPDIVLAAVIGVPDSTVGQEIAAFVSLRDGSDLAPEAIAVWCRERIALYKYPRLVAILPSLPTNSTGKILKRALDPSSLRRVDLG